MTTCGFVALWIGCVILGAIAGFLLGYVLWKLGFELLGSSVALVGAGAGGIMAFLAVLAWGDRISERRRARNRG